MWNLFSFTLLVQIYCLLATKGIYFTLAQLDTPLKSPLQQISIVNAFVSCNIRVTNFKGLNVDFQKVNEPLLLIRYLSHCQKQLVFPIELGSAYPELNRQNSSTCNNYKVIQAILPSDEIAIKYVAQTLSESFQLKSKNIICEADVYLHPPSERDSPQMYMKHKHWPSVLKNPIFINLYASYNIQEWKLDYLVTVPAIFLLICNTTTDSICGNQIEVKKWIASIFYEILMVRLSVSVLIWEYPSVSLKTLCPYCDSFKVISLQSQIIPTSRSELENILKENKS